MTIFLNLKNLLLTPIFVCLLGALFFIGCSEGTQIGAPTSESIGFHGGGGDDGLNISDEELSDEQLRDRERNRNDDDDDSRKDDFQYPKLNFKILRSPSNFSTCVEHGSKGTKQVTADMDIELFSDRLEANMKEMHVWVDSDHQGEADGETNKNKGVTLFSRPSADEIKDFKDDIDFDFTTTAIFAVKVEKQAKGETYTFDAPLPVFAFPVPQNRYDELEGSKSWTANVTTSKGQSYEATITLTKVSETADGVVIKLETFIPQDTDLTLYEDFPVPKRSIYTLDLKEKNVKNIVTLSEYHPDSKNCAGGGNRDRVEATYTLCSKVKDGETTTFPCL
jgi:hypothetical protein